MKNLWVRLSDFQVVSGRAVELQIELSSIQLTASLENNTEVTEFILRELSNAPELQGPLLITFTLLYLISAVGNLGTIQLIPLGCCLRTRAYFSLSDPKWRSLQTDEETMETVKDFIFLSFKPLQMVTAAMKLKDAYSLEEKLWQT